MTRVILNLPDEVAKQWVDIERGDETATATATRLVNAEHARQQADTANDVDVAVARAKEAAHRRCERVRSIPRNGDRSTPTLRQIFKRTLGYWPEQGPPKDYR